MHAGKIFCIGFQKTGTSSVGRALSMLGYRVCGAVGVMENDEEQVRRMALEKIERFDAFQDNPWPLLYKELDEAYPDSKFILTRREPQAWIESVNKHFGTTPRPMLKWIYGVPFPKGNEQIFLDRYEQHNREVLEYFSERPGSLLVLDIESTDHWEKIAAFLDAVVPAATFPHMNKGGTVWKLQRRLKRFWSRATGRRSR